MDVSPVFSLFYRLPGDVHDRSAEIVSGGVVTPPEAAGELGLVLDADGEVWRLSACASRAVRIVSIGVRLSLPVSSADAVFLNGYESWTDSWERPPRDRMPGLSRAPRGVVRKYVLDGSGDYRFTRYDDRRGLMHGFGYCYLRHGVGVVLVGSLDEDSGFTTLRTSADDDTVTLEKEPPDRELAAGEARELVSFAVCDAPLDEAVGRWLDLAGIHALPARPLVGFTSWYRHYGDIDAGELGRDLKGVARVLGGIDVAPAIPTFQIDDGYAKVGDWLDYDRVRFPEGLAPLAREAVVKGLTPGIWLAPFVCERESRLFSEHPDWLLRDGGNPVETGCNWSGAYALDIRNPEVRGYIANVLGTVTSGWGFRLLKLDFLFAACMLPHGGLNRGELMADALDLIRDSIPEGVSLLLCGVPLVSAFGRCEYCRIGCDVGLDWDDKPYMRLLHRERVSTKNSLGNTRGRAHLDGKAFRCDPDVFFLRTDDVRLSDTQREELVEADARLGGVLFTSDDMGAWDDRQLARYRSAVATFVAKEA